jgi:hypothetical protein
VTVISGSTQRGRMWFISNWSQERSTLTVPHDVAELDGRLWAADSVLTLEPWACLVVTDETIRPVDADRRS